MKNKKFLLFLTIFILLSGCKAQDKPIVVSDNEPPVPPIAEPAPVPQPAPAPNKKIRIVAVGDNLLHNTVSAFCKSGDSFDFGKLYTRIAPFNKASDFAFVNEEVPLAGPVGKYPMLSAPTIVASALREAGFNVVNQASNHSLDKGEKGLITSINALKDAGFEGVLGAFTSQEQADKQIIIEKQGVRFGFLSYTYGTNGIPVPGDKKYLVSLIDQQKMQSDLAALRQNCDYIITSVHWGTEYQFEPNDIQKQLAQQLADWGTDMIIGHHPHVIQPMEMLSAADGRQVICMYSLGNFVSGQHKVSTMLGGMMDVSLEFTADNKYVGADAGVMPIITHFEGKAADFDIYPIDEYTNELAARHGISNWEKAPTLDTFKTMATKVFGKYCIMEGRR